MVKREFMDIINLIELEALAKEKLTENAYGYYVSGADGEVTLRKNRAAFDLIHLYFKVLVDVSQRNLETTFLGHKLSLPVMIAPTAFHKLACPQGETATAKAAKRAGTIMILSSLSNTDVEEVVQKDSPLFFQLYIYKDRQVTEALVKRVEKAGCQALVVTVDAPFLGRRERDVKNRFTLPPGLFVKNLLPAGLGELEKQSFESGLAAYFASLIDASFSWKDIAWLKSITHLPLIIKGIVRPDDALRARDHGAQAIVVSNHGGRQLDTSPATIEALPPIADALKGSLEILLDGGVRRGTDVIKALAYGAKAVLIGRAILWGLALEGEEGALAVLNHMKKELDLDLALTGCPRIDLITRDLVP